MKLDGPTTDLAIFNVRLLHNGRINKYGLRLSAIGAIDGGFDLSKHALL